jgi:hypothetical protein
MTPEAPPAQDTRDARARYTIFAVLWVTVLATLLWRPATTLAPSPPTRSLYDAIEAIPREKLVIISASWDVGTRGENGPQTAAIIEHLFRTGHKFAIFGWVAPPGPLLVEMIARDLARKYHKRYGVDWVNWGFKTGTDAMIMGLAKNIPAIIRQDMHGTPITKLPAMKGVKDHRDVGMVIEITGSGTLLSWIQFWQGVYGTNIGYCPTGVMVPDAFPFLDAKQIRGLLKGLAGAAEYENLLRTHGDASVRMTAQSASHLVIILLIILGNIAFFRRGKRQA